MDRVSPYLLVFVGAGLGGVARLVLNNAGPKWFGYDFPWATMVINVTGSLLMGLLVGWLAFRQEAPWSQHVRLFLATGVLGGYTTFSTFSLESVTLIEKNAFGLAAAYIGGSVALGIAGVFVGLALMRSLL
jgi:CrcB protein